MGEIYRAEFYGKMKNTWYSWNINPDTGHDLRMHVNLHSGLHHHTTTETNLVGLVLIYFHNHNKGFQTQLIWEICLFLIHILLPGT